MPSSWANANHCVKLWCVLRIAASYPMRAGCTPGGRPPKALRARPYSRHETPNVSKKVLNPDSCVESAKYVACRTGGRLAAQPYAPPVPGPLTTTSRVFASRYFPIGARGRRRTRSGPVGKPGLSRTFLLRAARWNQRVVALGSRSSTDRAECGYHCVKKPSGSSRLGSSARPCAESPRNPGQAC